jgi:hypothetical protein
MENHKLPYLKTDDNKIINVKCIKWVKKMGDCLEVCTKLNGCSIERGETHTICKHNNGPSYNMLNKHFE